MGLVFHIAWRYLFAKKSHNVINVISLISAIGIAIGCMVLVVILSVYNGFDNLIKSLYDTYQPEYIIEPQEGRRFVYDGFSESVAPIVEEQVFCTYNGAQCVATLCGVDSTFLRQSRLSEHLVDGEFNTGIGEINGSIVSGRLAITLGIRTRFTTPLMLYYPKADTASFLPGFLAQALLMTTEDPMEMLSSMKTYPSGTIELEKSFDAGFIFIPIERARQLLQYAQNEVSKLYIYGKPGERERISAMMGEGYVVKDRFMQNSTMYRMMKSEKVAVYLILLFVVVIVSFNIFGSLSMLRIDKREDIATLASMGATDGMIKNIFVLQGTLISALGALVGVIMGIIISLCQHSLKVISLPGNFIIDYYPVELQAADVIYTLVGVVAVGYLISRIPQR